MQLLKSQDLENKIEYDRIIVIINKTTKYGYFILYKETNKVEHIVFQFLLIVVAQHGIPDKIIINRDIRFTSKL